MSTLVSSLGSPFGAAGDTPILAAQSLSVAIMAGSIRACSLRSSLFRSAASVRRTGDGSPPAGRLLRPDRTHRGVGEYRRASSHQQHGLRSGPALRGISDPSP